MPTAVLDYTNRKMGAVREPVYLDAWLMEQAEDWGDPTTQPTTVGQVHSSGGVSIGYRIYRNIVYFDLSSLTPPLNILSAKMTSSGSWSDNVIYAEVFDGDSLQNNDYDFGRIRLLTIPLGISEGIVGGYSTTRPWTITFNQTGLDYLRNRLGQNPVKFALRSDDDRLCSPPSTDKTYTYSVMDKWKTPPQIPLQLTIEYSTVPTKGTVKAREQPAARLLSSVRTLSAVRNIDP